MLFDHPDFDGHERVIFHRDAASDLRAIIAIHSTRLGPAAGGCRMYPYRSEGDALRDVLRLSRAMTFKNALAGLKLGGGKSVIIGDPADSRAAARLQAFGRAVEALGGVYWTAEDVGVNLDAIEAVARTTRYVFGTSSREGATGDPSAFTARGVFAGMGAAVGHRFGKKGVEGLRVAVQGAGSVGLALCRILREHGAQLVVADTRSVAAIRAGHELGAEVVAPDALVAADADVFAPCALGEVLNRRTIPELKARVVCGSANNPLERAQDGAALAARGVLYAPDFVVNAGGMIHASGEIFGRYDRGAVDRRIEAIAATVSELCARADAEGSRPEIIAERMAAERVAKG